MSRLLQVGGFAFAIGLPLFCLYLLLSSRRARWASSLFSIALIIVGASMLVLDVTLGLADIGTLGPHHLGEILTGVVIWTVPSAFLAYTGWRLLTGCRKGAG